MFDGTYISNI